MHISSVCIHGHVAIPSSCWGGLAWVVKKPTLSYERSLAHISDAIRIKWLMACITAPALCLSHSFYRDLHMQGHAAACIPGHRATVIIQTAWGHLHLLLHFVGARWQLHLGLAI